MYTTTRLSAPGIVIGGSDFTGSSTFAIFSGITDFSRFSDFSAATVGFGSDKTSSGAGLGRAEKARVILVARWTRWKMVGRLTSLATETAAAAVEQLCDDEDGSSGMVFKSETLPWGKRVSISLKD